MMRVHTDFILNKCPVGIMVFNRKMQVVYRNRRANSFLSRFEMPPEITAVNNRIFNEIGKGTISELFPGDIYLTRKLAGSTSNWVFRLYIYEKPYPLIYVVIMEETISNKLDMNEVRQKFRLTRRETDIVRRVIDGLRNIEIAEELGITEQTVKDHLSKIYKKIGVENRMALMRILMNTSNIQSEST